MDEGKTEKVRREFSAGGVVYKLQEGKVYFLITKSNPSKDYPFDVWRLPKGWIDDDKDHPGPLASGAVKASQDDLERAALREVEEEGGVKAMVIQKLGTEKIFFKTKSKSENVLKFITYFLMEWVSNLPKGFGKETSEVAWLQYSDANKLLSYSSEKKVLDKAVNIISSRT